MGTVARPRRSAPGCALARPPRSGDSLLAKADDLIWVEGVRLPDGSRTTASAAFHIKPTARIPNPGRHGFTHGVINWESDDIAFVPLPRNPPQRVDELLQPILDRMLESRELVELVAGGVPSRRCPRHRALQLLPETPGREPVSRSACAVWAPDRRAEDMGEDYLDFYLNDDSTPTSEAWPCFPPCGRPSRTPGSRSTRTSGSVSTARLPGPSSQPCGR